MKTIVTVEYCEAFSRVQADSLNVFMAKGPKVDTLPTVVKWAIENHDPDEIRFQEVELAQDGS